jgi:hypothetical protein
MRTIKAKKQVTRTIIKYECEVCNKVFNIKDNALNCEMQHDCKCEDFLYWLDEDQNERKMLCKRCRNCNRESEIIIPSEDLDQVVEAIDQCQCANLNYTFKADEITVYCGECCKEIVYTCDDQQFKIIEDLVITNKLMENINDKN